MIVVNKRDQGRRGQSASFLLAQVGAHAAAKFAERLTPLGFAPPHAGILRVLDHASGMSQQRLSAVLKLHPSRLVAIIDELESRGLVERRESEEDRSSYALHLTAKGKTALADIGRVAREHDAALCAALSERERGLLAQLLARVADEQGLTAMVHPGFSQMAPRREP
jgi:DNA-binding MarR family transcriptional regulator